MAESNVCPICGKKGIPNYHKEDVVCPQCGSDLSIYRVVDKIPDKKGHVVWVASTIAAFIAAVVLAVILVCGKSGNGSSVDNNYIALQDSIKTLNSELSGLKTQESPSASGFSYIVRKGDSFWRISQRMFGTGTKASAIAEVNNMSLHDVLNVGHTLIIK